MTAGEWSCSPWRGESVGGQRTPDELDIQAGDNVA
jgi:hypothetical protein